MPIYAYRCEACGHAKDVLQKVSDPVLNTCPACGAQAFRKQLTAAGFQLKGSGWYVTDFKGNGQKPASGDKGEGAKADGAPTGKAEAQATDGSGGKGANAAAPAADKPADKASGKSAALSAVKAADKPPPPAGSGSTPP